VSSRSPLPLIAPAPSPAQAAAIVAALERFMRDTAATPRNRPSPVGGWLRIARLEAVGSGPQPPAPWDESEPWPAASRASFANP
jgi:hypothetical protein